MVLVGKVSFAIPMALVAGAACGRISFDPLASADAGAACTGDLIVDSADDDPALALACTGAGCSLRAAVGIANARTGTTICVAEDLAITLATQVAVGSDVTITGQRSSICGAGGDRLFEVTAGGVLRLRNLTLCRGRLTDDAGAAVRVRDGGGLDTDGVVFDDHVVDAASLVQDGGAVRTDGATAIAIRRSRFTNNQIAGAATARGGAIGIRATAAARVTIEDCAFEDNTAASVGGALFLVIDGNNLTVERTLFARNGSNEGAAIDINCAATNTLTFASSTFADNYTIPVGATRSIVYVCGATTARLAFTTFSGNQGAAVRADQPTSRVEWKSSVVRAGPFDRCTGGGIGTSVDANVIDHDDAICPLIGLDVVADPLLGPLADNGGPTATFALLTGSPAIDVAGTSCPTTDQRGEGRPSGLACDAGAFEVQ